MLLAQYAALHNEGVRTGSFTALGRLFAVDAEMHFAGVPVGPFIGREAILQAFATHPPDDELVLREIETTRDGERCQYSWARSPTVVAGTLELTRRGTDIRMLRISAAPTHP